VKGSDCIVGEFKVLGKMVNTKYYIGLRCREKELFSVEGFVYIYHTYMEYFTFSFHVGRNMKHVPEQTRTS
jgi:hypothetical protein